jgi:hypothetical protein
MRPGRRWGSAALALLLALGAPLATTGAAMAGASDRRMAAWTKAVTSGRTVKERLAAVTALAGSSDRRALGPLVTALGDPSELVRALAASALGKLGVKSALVALRAAAEDADATVRSKAREAYGKICKANGMADDLAGAAAAPASPAPSVATVGSGKAGFGSSPHAVKARPTLYVVLKSSTDDSAGKFDARTRKLHADHVLASMATALRGRRHGHGHRQRGQQVQPGADAARPVGHQARAPHRGRDPSRSRPSCGCRSPTTAAG